MTPGGELDQAIERALAAPLLVERRGTRYQVRVEPPDDLQAGYDPDAALAAFDAAAGGWADLDADQLIARVYRAREEGSRPTGRP